MGVASDYHPTVGLVVAGGNSAPQGSGNALDSVYRSKDNFPDSGVVFEQLPKLPKEIDRGCLVIVDEDEILRLGGKSRMISAQARYVWRILAGFLLPNAQVTFGIFHVRIVNDDLRQNCHLESSELSVLKSPIWPYTRHGGVPRLFNK